MFYNKEELERLRKEAEEYMEQMEKEEKGKRYQSAADLPIQCGHCGQDRFHYGKALLNTRGLTFFDLDWLNKDAITLECVRCGHIHWFGKEVDELDEDES